MDGGLGLFLAHILPIQEKQVQHAIQPQPEAVKRPAATDSVIYNSFCLLQQGRSSIPSIFQKTAHISVSFWSKWCFPERGIVRAKDNVVKVNERNSSENYHEKFKMLHIVVHFPKNQLCGMCGSFLECHHPRGLCFGPTFCAKCKPTKSKIMGKSQKESQPTVESPFEHPANGIRDFSSGGKTHYPTGAIDIQEISFFSLLSALYFILWIFLIILFA